MGVVSVLKKPKILIPVILAVVILIFGIWSGAACYGMLQSETIYENVRVGSVDLSGKTHEEAEKAIGEYVGTLQQKTIDYTLSDKTLSLSLMNVDYDCDIVKLVDEAYQTGRTGNALQRIFEILQTRTKGKKIDFALEIDKDTLKQEIAAYAKNNALSIGDYSYEITQDSIMIRPSKAGQKIDLDALMEDFIQKMQSDDFSGKAKIPISPVNFDRTNVDRLYDEIATQPEDARYEEKNGVMTGIESKDGISFDKDIARQILSEEKEEYVIPVIRTPARVTLANLDQGMYGDLLAIYTTNFSNNYNRTANIKIAADKINNCVLSSGQVFSFNQVVGPRTRDAGYKDATIYTANGLEDGLAGGICQVSSTLYNAVLLADLEIAYRTNHSYTVSYVPLGLDATVSYGTIDFKFKNNMATPVKIKASVSGSSLTISVHGIQTQKNKVVKTRNNIISTTLSPEKEVPDSSLAPGARVKKQNGQSGYVVEAFRDIYIDGVLVRTDTLTKSSYVPLPTIYTVGPAGIPQPSETPAPTSSAAPTPTVKPMPTPTLPATPVPTPEPTVPSQPELEE